MHFLNSSNTFNRRHSNRLLAFSLLSLFVVWRSFPSSQSTLNRIKTFFVAFTFFFALFWLDLIGFWIKFNLILFVNFVHILIVCSSFSQRKRKTPNWPDSTTARCQPWPLLIRPNSLSRTQIPHGSTVTFSRQCSRHAVRCVDRPRFHQWFHWSNFYQSPPLTSSSSQSPSSQQ